MEGKRKKYTPEFKREAVKLMSEQGVTFRRILPERLTRKIEAFQRLGGKGIIRTLLIGFTLLSLFVNYNAK